MKKLSVLFILLIACKLSPAQRINPEEARALRQKEDSMKDYAVKLLLGINASDRFRADSIFTKILVRALKVKNSFYFKFDSLQTISQQYAPDSTFRIFTWQMVINENIIRQHGAIQMRTPDGSLKLFPLIDKSDVTKRMEDTVGNNLGWIGAIYYTVIHKKSFNRDYYTLLGFDENNIRSDKKIIEVLTFNNGEPVFGGRYFSFERDSLNRSAVSRYIMEYKKEAGPRLVYDPDLDMIVMEHLIPESGQPDKKWNYVGDGDYEGFRWMNGKWVHVEKVYHYITPLGKEPVPNPIRDNQGNIDESKLKGNEDSGTTAPTGKTKTPVPKKKNGNDD